MGMTIDQELAEISDLALKIKANYLARLKADMVAMLENLDLEIDEHSYIYDDGVSKKSDYVSCEDMHNLIRIMINNLRRDNESSM